jgi:hypothetical protein
MNPGVRPGPHILQGLPTLTEVIAWPAGERGAATDGPRDAAVEVPPEAPAAVQAPALDQALLVERVLIDLQRNADTLLELRLREALEPAFARLADTLLRDVRMEFAATLRDIVERAVTQELARQRGR